MNFIPLSKDEIEQELVKGYAESSIYPGRYYESCSCSSCFPFEDVAGECPECGALVDKEGDALCYGCSDDACEVCGYCGCDGSC